MIIKCKRCGKNKYFKPSSIKNGRGKYCSKECYNPPILLICEICGESFRKSLCHIKIGKGKFCSRKCWAINLRELGIRPPSRLGKHISENHKKIIGDFFRGRPLSIDQKRKISIAQKGDKSNNWKGGISCANKIARMSIDFKLWREAVFKRDNWTCQKCFTRGGVLHPHHIKPFAIYKEIRFSVDNGLTLCKECHKEIHRRIK